MVIKRKILSLILICLVILYCTLKITVNATENSSKILINSSKSNVQNNENFTVSISANNTDIAAYTLWIYYEKDKTECISQMDNISIQDNRIMYTWYSSDGKNKNLNNLLELEFKPNQDGIATFTVTGEFYNETGEKLNFQGNSLDVLISDVTLMPENSSMIENQEENSSTLDIQELKEQEENSSQTDTQEDADLLAEVQNDDSSLNLGIMRTNYEGITPDFNAEILEYYLIVDETVNDLAITAIPVSKRAEVVISGNKNLKNGLNIVKITVSLNGNSKTYTIYVTKTNDASTANTNLETLEIENYTLEPEFQNNITNYYVEVSNTENLLNILALAEDSNAKVKMEGNNELADGTNNVVVTVTARDGITKKKYNIQAYKRNEEEESEYNKEIEENNEEVNRLLEEKSIETAENKENQENDNEANNKNKVIMIVVIIVAIIVIGVVVIIVRKKRKTVK